MWLWVCEPVPQRHQSVWDISVCGDEGGVGSVLFSELEIQETTNQNAMDQMQKNVTYGSHHPEKT